MKRILMGLVLMAVALPGLSQTTEKSDGKLGTGDAIRVTVFQQPDLTTEARVTEKGTIPMPLLGEVTVAGMTQRRSRAISRTAST
jgi:polysaccharide biosynthesis/export protein